MTHSFQVKLNGRTPCVKIVVCAPKGGVGKTTIIRGLLVGASKAHIKSIGINLDEQQTLVKWSERRKRQRDNHPEIVEVEVIQRSIQDYRAVLEDVAPYQLAIFDTPPGHLSFASSIASLCEFADLIIVPTGTSMDDLSETIPFLQRVAGPKGVFCLNKVNRQTTSFRKARQMLVRAGELCPIEIPQYEDIHDAFARGLTVLDAERLNGAIDVEAVWDFVRGRVGL